MPLVHDPREIADVEAVEPVLLSQAGMICMVVGINHIANEADAKEFYTRVNMMELLTGAFRSYIGDDNERHEVLLTPDEARSLIGYRTNVTAMTKAKFKGHLFSNYERFAAVKF
jgi:hypothetical protein